MMNHGDQILTLTAAQEHTQERMPVESIILRGTAAGVFDVTFGNTELLINNSANELMVQLAMNRSVNYIRLNSGPTNARMYVLLEKKR